MKRRLTLILATVLLCTLLISALALPASAAVTLDSPQKLETTFKFTSPHNVTDVYTSTSGTKLPYRLYVPADYDESKSYPLVLFFHGAGESGTDNNHIFRGGSILQRLLTKTERTEHPCIILAPQCADTGSNGKWVSTDWAPGTYDHTKIKTSPYMAAAEELLDKVINEYSVDKGRLYVSGMSMGGYGTWDIISRNPDKFAAAVPVCGGIDESYMSGLMNMPIWTFHCVDDPIVSSAGTKKAAELLKDNPNFKYTEYNRPDHDAWNEAYATDDLIEWMFSFKKEVAEPTPTPTPTPEETTTPNTTTPPVTEPADTSAPTAEPTEEPTSTNEGIDPVIIVVIAVVAIVVIGAVVFVIIKKKK